MQTPVSFLEHEVFSIVAFFETYSHCDVLLLLLLESEKLLSIQNGDGQCPTRYMWSSVEELERALLENIDAINILWQVGPKAPTGLMCLAPVEGTAG